jgi:hypothetical protein
VNPSDEVMSDTTEPAPKAGIWESQRFQYFPTYPGGDPFDLGEIECPASAGVDPEFYNEFTWEGYEEHLEGMSPFERDQEDRFWDRRFEAGLANVGYIASLAFQGATEYSPSEALEDVREAFGSTVVDGALGDLLTEIDLVLDQPRLLKTCTQSVLTDYFGPAKDPDKPFEAYMVPRTMSALQGHWLVWKHTKYFDNRRKFSGFADWMGIDPGPIIRLHLMQHVLGFSVLGTDDPFKRGDNRVLEAEGAFPCG